MAVNNANAFHAFLVSCKAQGVKPTVSKWESFVRLMSAWRAA